MSAKNNNHLFVNWVDGMKINKDHFIETDRASIQYATNIGKSIVLPNSYGLLPLHSQKESSVDIKLSLDGQNTITAQLNNCTAITSKGVYIEINDDTRQLLGKNASFETIRTTIDLENSEGQQFYIVLGVDLYNRLGVGEADAQENPPRHPYTIPKYTLGIVTEEELENTSLGGQHLTVGKLSVESGTPTLLVDYIPPCTSIQSHQDLIYIYSELGVFLTSIEKYSLQVLQKILQKKQTNELAVMVQTICQNTLNFLSGIIPSYLTDDMNQPPLKMMVHQMSLARVIKNNIDIYKGTGKEELINYLTSWSESTQGDFEKILEDVIHLQYKHYDLNLSLHLVSKFSKIILALFKKLDDLDYIGQKSDSNIFVKEEVVTKKEIKQRRSFLLD